MRVIKPNDGTAVVRVIKPNDGTAVVRVITTLGVISLVNIGSQIDSVGADNYMIRQTRFKYYVSNKYDDRQLAKYW
jgi:hypothetical protein